MEDNIRYNIRRQMVSRLHDIIKRRYRRENLEDLPQIKDNNLLLDIAQDDIDQIVRLFSEMMYPPLEEREERDKSMEILMHILKNPIKLIHYLPRMPKIIARYGRFWKAIHAGIDVISTYKTSTAIEEKALAYIESYIEESANPEDLRISEALVMDAYHSVSQRENRKMIRKIKYLTEAGRDANLVKESVAILEEVKAEQTSEEEGKAAEFIIGLLKHLEELAASYPPEKLDRMVEIAEVVETAYLEELMEK